ncbi:MAG TPA: tyrosine-type recombinase/integrase, partial [Tepidiformaceae bacterium]
CFSWLRRMDVIEQNVFARVPLVKQPIVIKEPFSAKEIMTILTKEDAATYVGCRNRAIVLFLLDTGVRASECIGMELADLDWDRQRALVRHGKGDKQRWVGFSQPTGDMVREYIDRFRKEEPGALFLTSKQKPMQSGTTLNWIMRRVAVRAGVAHVNPHRFRHTFATWAIESGAREIDVQMLLGHADLTMTHRYARTYTSEQAVRAHAQLSPANMGLTVGLLIHWSWVRIPPGLPNRTMFLFDNSSASSRGELVSGCHRARQLLDRRRVSSTQCRTQPKPQRFPRPPASSIGAR